MKKFLTIIVSALFAVSLNAQPPQDAFAAEVLKSIELQHTAETMSETMRLNLQPLVANGTMTSENLNAYCQKISEIMLPKLLERMIELYQQNFTLSEMKQMNAYLASPVGQKSLKLSPMFATEGAKIAQSPEMQKKIQETLIPYLKK